MQISGTHLLQKGIPINNTLIQSVRSLSVGAIAFAIFEFLRFNQGWLYKPDDLLITQLLVVAVPSLLYFALLKAAGGSLMNNPVKIAVPALFILVVGGLFAIGTLELSHQEYEATLSYSFYPELPQDSIIPHIRITETRVHDVRNDLIQVKNDHLILGERSGDVLIYTFCDGELVDEDLQQLKGDTPVGGGDKQVTLNNLPFGADCRAEFVPKAGRNKTVHFTVSPFQNGGGSR